MIKFSEEMKERINTAAAHKKLCIWVTASKEGEPSIGYRDGTFVWDDEHLAFWVRPEQDESGHIDENPNVVMLYMDFATRVGWRFFGQATLYKAGPIRQQIMDRVIKDQLDEDPERKGYGVLARVDKILRYSGDEVIQQR